MLRLMSKKKQKLFCIWGSIFTFESKVPKVPIAETGMDGAIKKGFCVEDAEAQPWKETYMAPHIKLTHIL